MLVKRCQRRSKKKRLVKQFLGKFLVFTSSMQTPSPFTVLLPHLCCKVFKLYSRVCSYARGEVLVKSNPAVGTGPVFFLSVRQVEVVWNWLANAKLFGYPVCLIKLLYYPSCVFRVALSCKHVSSGFLRPPVPVMLRGKSRNKEFKCPVTF